MREIKFRAYDKRNKQIYDVLTIKWTYGDILRKHHKNIPDGYYLPEEVLVLLGNGKSRTFNYYPRGKTYMKLPNGQRYIYSMGQRSIRDLILLEFTGLKDLNGIEIYEGDIVKWVDRIDEVNIREIRYGSYELEADCGDISKHQGFYMYPTGVCESIGNQPLEVVGSVYSKKVGGLPTSEHES